MKYTKLTKIYNRLANWISTKKTKQALYCEVEPWNSGRSVGRLLHDFGLLSNLLCIDKKNSWVLDFGAGSCWLAEFLARLGHKVVCMDIHKSLSKIIKERKSRWVTQTSKNLFGVYADGHTLPFQNEKFDFIVCFDSLHHMASFPKVISQMFRVLKQKGRIVFVEPGASHSRSDETIKFLEENQFLLGPDWIERDIVLEEIEEELHKAGFSRGLRILPKLHPINHPVYDLASWKRFLNNDHDLRKAFCDYLADINYNHHLIFFVDK